MTPKTDPRAWQRISYYGSDGIHRTSHHDSSLAHITNHVFFIFFSPDRGGKDKVFQEHSPPLRQLLFFPWMITSFLDHLVNPALASEPGKSFFVYGVPVCSPSMIYRPPKKRQAAKPISTPTLHNRTSVGTLVARSRPSDEYSFSHDVCEMGCLCIHHKLVGRVRIIFMACGTQSALKTS